MECKTCGSYELYKMVVSGKPFGYSGDIPCLRCPRCQQFSDQYSPAYIKEAASTSTNSDYTAALRSTIEAWSHYVGIADSIDEKGVVDLMQRLNTLKAAYFA